MARPEQVDEAAAAIASAHHWLACSRASAWVARQAVEQGSRLGDERGRGGGGGGGHQYPPSVEPAAASGTPPALRARKSSMIAFVAVAPMRVVPRAMTSRSASSVRTPPAALTWMCGDVFARIRREVVVRRAAGREPGRGLDEVGPGGLGQAAGADLLVVGQVGVLEDDLDDRAGGMGDLDDRRDVGLDVGVAARTGARRSG